MVFEMATAFLTTPRQESTLQEQQGAMDLICRGNID